MTFGLLVTAIQGATVVGLVALVVLLYRLTGRVDVLARRLRPLDAIADRLGELGAPGAHAADTDLAGDTPPEGVHARSRRAPGLVDETTAAMRKDRLQYSQAHPVVAVRESAHVADEHGRRPSSVRVPS